MSADDQQATSSNPLGSYFRKPEVYIKLPSCGYYNDPGDIETSPTGELAVCAMTAADDLLLKTPDALLNGESIARVVQSCVPSIKQPYKLASPDIDAILLAIRQASYGDEMEVEATCPKCENTNTYAASISYALTTMTFLDKEYFVTLSTGLQVQLRPQTYAGNVREALRAYEEAKIIQTVIEEEISDEEKAERYGAVLHDLAELLVELTSECIVKIVGPDGKVIDASHDNILEWIRNIPMKDAETIKSKLAEINGTGVNSEMSVKCSMPDCGHEWEATVEFDPSHFFE